MPSLGETGPYPLGTDPFSASQDLHLFVGGLSLTTGAHTIHECGSRKYREVLPWEPQSVGWWMNNQAVCPLGWGNWKTEVPHCLPVGLSSSCPRGNVHDNVFLLVPVLTPHCPNFLHFLYLHSYLCLRVCF